VREIDENHHIFLDLDRDRIRTVLRETYNVGKDILGADFQITVDDFVSKIEPFLDSNRVSTIVLLHLPSRKHPELKIEVNLRKKSVIARMFNKFKRVELNRFLTKL
jgi:hypothetical protein